jgi:hypothetical protein
MLGSTDAAEGGKQAACGLFIPLYGGGGFAAANAATKTGWSVLPRNPP